MRVQGSRAAAIAAAVVALVAAVAALRPSLVKAREVRVEVVSGDESLRVILEGEITYTKSGLDVASLSPGGHLVVEGRAGADERRVAIHADDRGTLRRQFFVGGREQEYGSEARALLSRALPELQRPRRGEAATGEVRRSAGRSPVENEHELRQRLEGELAAADAAGAARILDRAARSMDSDWEMAELLTTAAREHPIDGLVQAAFFRAVRTIDSDWDRRRALTAALRPGLASALAEAVLDSGREIRSDYERAELIIAVLRVARLETGVRAAVERALEDMDSEWERGRVRSELARRLPARSAER